MCHEEAFVTETEESMLPFGTGLAMGRPLEVQMIYTRERVKNLLQKLLQSIDTLHLR